MQFLSPPASSLRRFSRKNYVFPYLLLKLSIVCSLISYFKNLCHLNICDRLITVDPQIKVTIRPRNEGLDLFSNSK